MELGIVFVWRKLCSVDVVLQYTVASGILERFLCDLPVLDNDSKDTFVEKNSSKKIEDLVCIVLQPHCV